MLVWLVDNDRSRIKEAVIEISSYTRIGKQSILDVRRERLVASDRGVQRMWDGRLSFL